MTLSILWQTPFTGRASDQSAIDSALYATFSFPVFTIGLCTLVIPALAGKAYLFRFVYGSQTWTMLSQMSLGLINTIPMVAIFYFFATQHPISVDYYLFIYYYTANIVFGMSVYSVLVMPIDTPILSLINLKRDLHDAQDSLFYRLNDYLQNFKP
jgi:hypothetical protein